MALILIHISWEIRALVEVIFLIPYSYHKGLTAKNQQCN